MIVGRKRHFKQGEAKQFGPLATLRGLFALKFLNEPQLAKDSFNEQRNKGAEIEHADYRWNRIYWAPVG
jgi:hypothetical protein